MKRYSDVDACVDAIIARVGNEIRLGLPLGLGKPHHLVNALYQRAKRDPSIQLHIFTALSLEKPTGKPGLERRFMGPFAARQFEGVPDLDYVLDLRKGALPANVTLSEFFFKAGSYLGDATQQQRYICTNYTHAVRDLLAAGINVVAQMVSADPQRPDHVSLSCNPDLSLDLLPALQRKAQAGEAIAIVGEINPQLPYMVNDAEITADQFDLLLDHPRYTHPLFGAPNMAIAPADHMIGFYASTLLRDGGTLQVGIGSLGSALTYSTCLRHQHNAAYRALADAVSLHSRFPISARIGGLEPFEEGLYGCSEMMVDGFMHLHAAGILKREVFDDPDLQELLNEGAIQPQVSLAMLDTLLARELISSPLRSRELRWLKRYGIFRDEVVFKGGRLVVDDQVIEPVLDDAQARAAMEAHCLGDRLRGGIIMHGGFFLGPSAFYQQLRDLSPETKSRICMTSVNYINHLYDHRFGNQRLKRAQRKEARFINSTMMHTLAGAAISDGLENGKVVSGVGGQYNFVAMGHEMPDARSILCLRSTRHAGGEVKSSIVFSYGHCTIPRHLRDIVITEYGIADLRGRSDEAVYTALIEIADARFQDELLAQAVKAGKVSAQYRIPDVCRNNTPEHLANLLKSHRAEGRFEPFPFGCDFTPDELQLGQALKRLKAATASRAGMFAAVWRAWRMPVDEAPYAALLARMGLGQVTRLRDKLERKLLLLALAHHL